MHPRARAVHALPAQSRLAASQAEWMAAVLAHPDTAALRVDAYANLCAVAEVLRNHMDWDSGLSRPTHAVIRQLTGLSRRSVTRWVRWLRDRGLLGVAVSGSTPATRPGNRGGLLDDGLGNLAAEYVLAVPAGDQEAVESGEQAEVVPLRPGCPADSSPASGERTGAPSRDLFSQKTDLEREIPCRARVDAKASCDAAAITWPLTATPRTKQDQLRACERLRVHDMTLRRLSARHLRSILRPALREGVTPADILHMINHSPEGAHTYTDQPRWVPAWLRWRLGAWWDLTGDGPRLRVEDLPSRRAAAAHETNRRAAAQRAAERAEALANRADASKHAAAARAALAAASPRAAKVVGRLMQQREEMTAEQVSREELRARLEVARDRVRAHAEQMAKFEADVEVSRLVEPESVFREHVIERHGSVGGGRVSVQCDRAWLTLVVQAKAHSS